MEALYGKRDESTMMDKYSSSLRTESNDILWWQPYVQLCTKRISKVSKRNCKYSIKVWIGGISWQTKPILYTLNACNTNTDIEIMSTQAEAKPAGCSESNITFLPKKTIKGKIKEY